MDNIESLKDNLGEQWKILSEIHDIIISARKRIHFRIFPIYIRYIQADKIFALVYFKGKFAPNHTIKIGLNLKNKPEDSYFVSGAYMKLPEIRFSIKVSEQNYVKVVGLLKKVLKNDS